MTDRHLVRALDRRVGERPLQRAVAAVSLVAGGVGVVLVALAALRHPLVLVALVVAALVVLAAGFTALTTTGVRRAAYGTVAVVASIGLVAGVVVETASRANLRGFAVVGGVLVVLAALGARYSLRVPPPSGERLWVMRPTGPTAARPVLLANPRSGGGAFARCGIAGVAAEHGVEVVLLPPDGDLGRLAAEAADAGADALGMAGGDGSLAVVASVCVERDLPFVCVPAGTRNHFALDLGLDRSDPARALAAFVRGDEHRVDAASVNGRLFLNNVSLGVYAAAVEQPGYRDDKVGTALGLVPELVAAGGPWFDLHLDVPGHGRLETAALVQVSNGAYELGGVAFGRRLHLDRGELGVIVVDPSHVGDLVAITALTAARRPELASGVWPWTTPALTIGSGQAELGAGVDGEHVRLTPPLELVAHPGALRVLVPEGTAVGLAAQHRGARGAIGGLLEVAFNVGPDGGGD